MYRFRIRASITLSESLSDAITKRPSKTTLRYVTTGNSSLDSQFSALPFHFLGSLGNHPNEIALICLLVSEEGVWLHHQNLAMTGSRPKKRARRSHALGGCASCRRRHVKCDQIRPTCLTCRAIGLICEGYSTDLKWMTEGRATQPVRRHLYNGNYTVRRHLH